MMVLRDLIIPQEVDLDQCEGDEVVDILGLGMNMALLCVHRTTSIQDWQAEFEETTSSHQCGDNIQMRR